MASLVGRYYAMDRNQNWDRTKAAYNLLTTGEGRKFRNAEEAINVAYKEDLTDEFITPRVIIDERSRPVGLIKDNDVVICYNHRADRVRQLTSAFF